LRLESDYINIDNANICPVYNKNEFGITRLIDIKIYQSSLDEYKHNLFKSKVEINMDDFKIMKILISERYCELNHKIGTDKEDEVNKNAYEIIKNLFHKYCDSE
jgi:hypothetical protein